MPNNALEIVAHYENDYETRMKLYWYGNTEIAMDSDTDGDGATFAEELAAANPAVKVLKHEENHIMQHTLQSLKGELKWAIREFSRGSAHAK